MLILKFCNNVAFRLTGFITNIGCDEYRALKILSPGVTLQDRFCGFQEGIDNPLDPISSTQDYPYDLFQWTATGSNDLSFELALGNPIWVRNVTHRGFETPMMPWWQPFS